MAASQSVIKYSDCTMERAVDSCNSTFVPRSYHNFISGFKNCTVAIFFHFFTR